MKKVPVSRLFLWMGWFVCIPISVMAASLKISSQEKRKKTEERYAQNISLDLQQELSIKYYFGKDPTVPKDLKKAFYWARRAAESAREDLEIFPSTRAPVYNNLGFMYKAGKGCAKDYEKAFSLLKESIEQDLSKTPCFNLAAMYYSGRGTEKDEKKAFDLFRSALQPSAIFSLFNLFLLLEKNPQPALDEFLAALSHSEFHQDFLKKAFSFFKRILDRGEEAENDFLELLASVSVFMAQEGGSSINYTGSRSLKDVLKQISDLINLPVIGTEKKTF